MHELITCCIVAALIFIMLVLIMFVLNYDFLIGYRNSKFLDDYLKEDTKDEQKLPANTDQSSH